MGTKRHVPPEDKARYWACRQAGMTQGEAARVAGIHINTASNWEKKSRRAKAELEVARLEEKQTYAKGGGAQRQQVFGKLNEAVDLPPAIPADRLCDAAKRGLEDFDFFRRYYLGRVPSPWQVEAAYVIVKQLESEEKEFLVLNCPPGAGKSTLFHDVAVWCIVRNRSIRILIGSVSQALAKMYSRRIRDTLQRPTLLEPDPELVRKGLAVKAEGCLSIDYGRFQPSDKGALWRAEEFIVEQDIPGNLDNKEPTVRAYGIDAEFIGHRADLCLFDDVANSENSKESSSRDKLLEKWDNTAEARVDPGGVLAVIGQRLSSSDLYAHCLAKFTYDDDDFFDGDDVNPEDLGDASKEPMKIPKYKHIVYKAYYEELDTGRESRSTKAKPYPDGPLLDPVRLSWKDLSVIRQSNPPMFKVVYQQEDMAEDSYLCNRTWLTGGLGPDGVLYPGCIDDTRLPGHIPPGLAPPIVSLISIDPSPTQFWGILWILYQPETNLYHVIDVKRTKLTAEALLGYNTSTQEYSGLLEEMVNDAWSLGYPVSHVIVEINAAQRFLLAHDFVKKWQALHQLNIVPHTTSRNKLDQNLGIEALIPPIVRSGSLRLPTMRGNWQTLALVDELTKWQRDKKSGTDLAMALWFATLHAQNLSGVKQPPRLWRPSWL
jgi:transcriptional regulator with XRE-family HTH domain